MSWAQDSVLLSAWDDSDFPELVHPHPHPNDVQPWQGRRDMDLDVDWFSGTVGDLLDQQPPGPFSSKEHDDGLLAAGQTPCGLGALSEALATLIEPRIAVPETSWQPASDATAPRVGVRQEGRSKAPSGSQPRQRPRLGRPPRSPSALGRVRPRVKDLPPDKQEYLRKQTRRAARVRRQRAADRDEVLALGIEGLQQRNLTLEKEKTHLEKLICILRGDVLARRAFYLGQVAASRVNEPTAEPTAGPPLPALEIFARMLERHFQGGEEVLCD